MVGTLATLEVSSGRHTQSVPTSAHRADVDGLRALAILPVLIFHAFPAQMPGGFIGVDVFFVISGYLITTIILRGLDSGSFSFPHFYANRVRRIFPALLVVLGCGLLAGWRLLLVPEFSQLGKHVAAGVGFSQNLVLWSEAGYFDAASESKPLLHLWSLGVEEQFYLFFPMLLWLVMRRGTRVSRVALFAALTVAGFAVSLVRMGTDSTAVYFLPQYRFWELTAGALVAAIGTSTVARPFREVVAAVAVVMVLAAALAFDRTTPFPGWAAALPVAGAALCILAGPDTWTNRRLLAHPWAVAIGLISYPLYLWHWPLLTFLRILQAGEPSRGLRTAAVVASFILAWLTYRFVERPIRNGRRPTLKVATLGAASVVIGIAGFATFSNDGVPGRFPEGLRQVVTYKFDPRASYRIGTCYLTSRSGAMAAEFADVCFQPEPGQRSVLLWGDSFSAAIYPGVKAAFADRSILQYSASMCPPILGSIKAVTPECAAINRFVLGKLQQRPPDEVMLAANWPSRDWQELKRTIWALRKAGVQTVVVVGRLPTWRQPLPDIVARVTLRSGVAEPPVWIPNDSLVNQLRVDDAVQEFALHHDADFVSPLRLLCNESGACLGRDVANHFPFTPLAFDTAHLTDVGSELLGRLLRDHPTARGKPL